MSVRKNAYKVEIGGTKAPAHAANEFEHHVIGRQLGEMCRHCLFLLGLALCCGLRSIIEKRSYHDFKLTDKQVLPRHDHSPPRVNQCVERLGDFLLKGENAE